MAPQAAAQPPHLPPHEHVAELTATLQRLQADFDNYKKYIEKERQRWQQDALRGFVRELLPVLDAFEIALDLTRLVPAILSRVCQSLFLVPEMWMLTFSANVLFLGPPFLLMYILPLSCK